MATLLSNTVWEGVSTEPRPTFEQGARDGQFFKELDTGETYIRVNGVFVFINLGLSYIKATKSGTTVTDINGISSIVFTTPFIVGAIISIQLTCESVSATSKDDPLVYFANVSEFGFGCRTVSYKTGKPVSGVKVAWLATRDYNP